VIGVIIGGMFSSFVPSNVVTKECGNRANCLGKNGRITLQTTMAEVNVIIIGFLLDSLKETEQSNIWLNCY
jgi:hypothetical protein